MYRFLCILCGVVMQVPPPGVRVIRRRLYGARAIALALCLFGLEAQSHHAVRAAVGVHATARDPAEGQRWPALVKWTRAARAGELLEGIHLTGGTLRAAAARIATVIVGHGAPAADITARVWSGAFEAPWRGSS
jgi:hypothetical protein